MVKPHSTTLTDCQRIAYIECFSGISGDMTLGALLDLGVSVDTVRHELLKLNLSGYQLEARQVSKNSVRATQATVRVQGHEHERKWRDIQAIIEGSTLSDDIKDKGRRLFQRLFETEALVHGAQSFEDIHLHELGAVDSLVDIFGVLICLKTLGIEKLYFSPINTGSGVVATAHGLLPVPAPATAELLKGAPIYSDNTPFELTTPTGALFASELAESFGPIPSMIIEAIGYGAGQRTFNDKPNVVRVLMGKRQASTVDDGNVVVIETNLDDMDPRFYELVMERLFQGGALDVFLTPIIMKKSRPAVTLSVICDKNNLEKLCSMLLEETTTIGVRWREVSRKTLDREIRLVQTPYGDIRVKVAKEGERIIKETPEYEDLKTAAQAHRLPIAKLLSHIQSYLNPK
jgi:hypothetical protein